MRFSPDFLDELRTRLPISTVIGQRVTFDPQKSKPSRGIFGVVVHFMVRKHQAFIVMIIKAVIIVLAVV